MSAEAGKCPPGNRKPCRLAAAPRSQTSKVSSFFAAAGSPESHSCTCVLPALDHAPRRLVEFRVCSVDRRPMFTGTRHLTVILCHSQHVPPASSFACQTCLCPWAPGFNVWHPVGCSVVTLALPVMPLARSTLGDLQFLVQYRNREERGPQLVSTDWRPCP